MFQLLKKCRVVLLFYFYCVQQVGCDDVHYVNGIAGHNVTVTFMLNDPIGKHSTWKLNMYRDRQKIHTLNIANRCNSSENSILSTACIDNMSPKNITLTFTPLVHSGMYHLAVYHEDKLYETNTVNLTVHAAVCTTAYTTVASLNQTSVLSQSKQKPSILLLVSVLVVIAMMMIVLLGSFYWNYRRKADKTPTVNATSGPQVIPDVTCVDYCVLDFPNRAGEKVRSTEERVEYSPIMFPPKITSAQNNESKSTAQQSNVKIITLQHEKRETDKVPEKPQTTKPKHQKCPGKKTHT